MVFGQIPKISFLVIPLERAPQGEQNGVNFSFVATSSEELYMYMAIERNLIETPYYNPWFSAKSDVHVHVLHIFYCSWDSL